MCYISLIINYFNNFTPLIVMLFISLYFTIALFFTTVWLVIWAVNYHIIVALIFLDILLLVNMVIFTLYSLWTINAIGYSIALLILCIAACETVIGLAIFIIWFRVTRKYKI